ncbi:MAG: substrate-binding domain-containing protein [Nitrospira sp.]|nr:substrate-binding domain-containing protein [Nitrospira sp.]
MRSLSRYMLRLGGVLALAGAVGTADAQTVLNAGGGSIGRNFFTDVALEILDQSPRPNRFASADNNRIVFTGNRNGSPVILRYSSGNGEDGILKLLQPANNAASNLPFLNHTQLTGGTGPVLTTRPTDNKQYNNTTGITSSPINLPVHVGLSPIQGGTYNQTGPIGVTTSPIDDSGLNVTPVVAVPLALFVGKGVVKNNNGAPGGPIEGLSQDEVGAIFSRQVTDWRQLGYGTVTDANPNALEATSPILLALRNAGAGQKSLFQEIFLKPLYNETLIPIPNQVIFSPNASGSVDVVANNRRAIGYFEAEELARFETGGNRAGLAYIIKVNGASAHDVTKSDPKVDFKSGRYPLWGNVRLFRRAAGEGAATDALAQAFVAAAGSKTTIDNSGGGRFWSAAVDLKVFKNSDRGPLLWKPLQ